MDRTIASNPSGLGPSLPVTGSFRMYHWHISVIAIVSSSSSDRTKPSPRADVSVTRFRRFSGRSGAAASASTMVFVRRTSIENRGLGYREDNEASYPGQRNTGSTGYFRKAGSVSDFRHSQNSDPLPDVTFRACPQDAQSPTFSF